MKLQQLFQDPKMHRLFCKTKQLLQTILSFERTKVQKLESQPERAWKKPAPKSIENTAQTMEAQTENVKAYFSETATPKVFN